ncbi:hypothetical protein ST27_22510 [Xanthomonas phaseoli pv. phaseoli]|nr:hypothetical protein ST27_22510 [Xanthomonas phaseoli pv. phaseoli]
MERALIVELDGSQHLDASCDAAREAFLHRKGFQLLRFWNNEVLVRTDAVCDAIARRLCVARFSLPPSGVR